MQEAYAEANEHAVAAGGSRGHFMVDLCRPGHMTACLRTFQETIGCNDDNWDAHFGALHPCLHMVHPGERIQGIGMRPCRAKKRASRVLEGRCGRDCRGRQRM